MNGLAPIDAKRRTLKLPERGVSISLLDWGGSGPLALLHHANGFCAALWAPVAEQLRQRFRVIAMDARGHGDSSAPDTETPDAYLWPTLAGDLQSVAAALLDETGQDRFALGLGHSFGGTLTLAAAQKHPGWFERLVLVDPVIISPATFAAQPDHSRHVDLVQRSSRRRRSWPSRDAAREHLASRELFAHWTPRALDLYVTEGLRRLPDDSVELKCAPEVEAAVFSGGSAMDTFASGAGVTTPTRFLWATRGNFAREDYCKLAENMEDGQIVDVDGGHLVLMERPEIVVDQVLDFAGETQS